MYEDYLPAGVTSKMVEGVNGLSMHILEAGDSDAPLLLLLHGFPELSFSWRKVIGPLAEAGWRVVAPDQRGYGGTTGWTSGYDVDLLEYSFASLTDDVAALVKSLGYDRAALVGHDFGSPVAAWSALLRPDLYSSVALMSAPFAGPPGTGPSPTEDLHDQLATLTPPRRHYQWRYGDREAEADFLSHPDGFDAVFRAYYHCKSGDWAENRPHKLPDWSAASLAVMPRYYIMDLGVGMGDQATGMAPQSGASCAWLTKEELHVYTDAFRDTGMQASLNWYRNSTSPEHREWAGKLAGQTIDIPACFIAGAQDWGVWQAPGALEAMEEKACTNYLGRTLIEGAGHWVQQEQPEQVVKALKKFHDQVL